MNRGRVFMAALIAIVGLIGYYGSRSKNEITGEVQHISLTEDQEIAMGMQSAPEMTDQFGGVDPDAAAQRLVSEVGTRIVKRTAAGATHYPFHFTLLAGPKTVNAFAVPGGHLFVYSGLLLAAELEGGEAGKVAAGLLDRGLVVNAVSPTALRFAPSLLVSDDEIDHGVSLLRDELAQ